MQRLHTACRPHLWNGAETVAACSRSLLTSTAVTREVVPESTQRSATAFYDRPSQLSRKLDAQARVTNPLLERFKSVFQSGIDGNVFEQAVQAPAQPPPVQKLSSARASASAVSSRAMKRWRKDTPKTLEGALKPSEQARVISELDPPYSICHVNPAWEDLSGYFSKEVIGQPAFSVLGGRLSDTRKSKLIGEVVDAYGYADLDMLHYTKGGEPFMNTVHVSALLSDNGRPTHLLSILHTLHLDELETLDGNAIEKGVTLAAHKGGRTTDAMDYALVNIGLMLKERGLTGRIITEVDPRLANDAVELRLRAEGLVAAYEARGCARENLLMQIPATWAGLEAVKVLESECIQCQVVHVFSFSQAVAAVNHKASVIVPCIRRINLWYDQHPGAIRDPKGPREDAGGGSSSVNVGVRLASAMYDFTRQFGAGTRIVMSGIRTVEEALQLSGADYLVLSDKLQAKLASEETLQGYNDGLSAAPSDEEGDDMPVLTPHAASQHDFSRQELEEVTEASFAEELGQVGRELLEQQLQSSREAVNRVEHFVENYATARE